MNGLLNDMALFVEVVQAKSFTRAAENTALPKSTLSTRINRLEQQIGLRLLNRTTRKIELTEAGAFYYERAQRIVEEAALAHRQLADMQTEPQGVLRVSLPTDFAHYFVVPLMPEFSARYPKIGFHFDLSPRRVDLVSEPFDLAVRIGALPDSTLVARKLMDMRSRVYAAAGYLARHGTPLRPEDLAQHACISMTHASGSRWRLLSDGLEKTVDITGNFSANNIGMVYRLTEQGLGIALLPQMIVDANATSRAEGSAGALQQILPGWHSAEFPIYALTATRLLPAKVQVFLDFLTEKISG